MVLYTYSLWRNYNMLDELEIMLLNKKIKNDDNIDELDEKIDIICRNAYQLEEIRKIAEAYKLSKALA